MAHWVPLKSDVLEAIGGELVQHNPTGRVAVAIRSLPGRDAEQRAFAQDLAAHAPREAVVGDSVSMDPVIQLVTGPATDDTTRFHQVIWLRHEGDDDYDARHDATIVVDTSDAEHPRRVFADAC